MVDKAEKRVALCLSGGGFRASIFHLGALTRLNELGVLTQVDVISSVSGGSIIAGHLAALLRNGNISWGNPGDVIKNWDDEVVASFVPFVRSDIRSKPFLLGLLPGISNSQQLARIYDKFFQGAHSGPLKLSEIPTSPQFIFCATNLFHGKNWEMTHVKGTGSASKTVVGDYKTRGLNSTDWTLGDSVASSSCFPPIFSPLKPRLSDKVSEDVRKYTRLSDGGLYDNLGLEPVWKTEPRVLVSDGGAPLNSEHKTGVKRLLRYNSVVLEQVGSLRKRWFVEKLVNESLDGTYWGIKTFIKDYELSGKPFGFDKEITMKLARVRTDLDPFSPDEITILMKHGYEVADAAVNKHQADLIRNNEPRRQWPSHWAEVEIEKIIDLLEQAEDRNYVRWPFITKRHKQDKFMSGLDKRTCLPKSAEP